MLFVVTMVLCLSLVINSTIPFMIVNLMLYTTALFYGTIVNLGGVLLLNAIDIATVVIIFCWFGHRTRVFDFCVFMATFAEKPDEKDSLFNVNMDACRRKTGNAFEYIANKLLLRVYLISYLLKFVKSSPKGY